MIKRTILLLITCLAAFPHLAQVATDYYISKEVPLDPKIPTPKAVLGHEVGEWHVSHDKLVQYMQVLAEASDRIAIETYGRSHENRPLLTLKISSPEHIKNLETIRSNHLKLSDYTQSSELDLSEMPAVVYLGYSIHGNEASGSNAALLVAYYLAAAQTSEVNNWLKHTVIILDPSYNPDGLNRFASWVNSKKGKNLVADPANIEQNEPWPRARTNHYWFDLNRDWLPVQHPESQGRVAHYHRWKPNVLTDHHEMGTNNTYFFQPGIPSRNNPLTPKNNYILTEKIASYHAKAFDKIGSLYYSEESFDDFYIGKGSSYPDINGGIGILFEQASARSHLQNSANGTLSFPFAIRNHLTSSLSTLRATHKMRLELLEHQRKFYSDIPTQVDNQSQKAYIFRVPHDHSKLKAFLSLIELHQIETYRLKKTIGRFTTKDSFVIPLKQNQQRLIQAMFEQRTQFQDSLFYDVSAWTLPLAFDIDFSEVNGKNYSMSMLGTKVSLPDLSVSDLGFEPSTYAYAFDWYDTQAPALLYDIQQLGIRTKASTEPWTSSEGRPFDRGSIIISTKNQNLTEPALYQHLIKLCHKHQIPLINLKSGHSTGIQLGSPKFKTLSEPKPILLIGDGVNAYEAGEVWHLLDQRIGIAVPMVTQAKCNTIDLSKYNCIIMVGGSYGTLAQPRIKAWVQQGGRIVALKSAGKWASEAGLSKVRYKKMVKDSTQKYLPYNQRIKAQGAQRIGGAIFQTKIDLTHPLFFGYQDDMLPTFKNGTLVMEVAKNPYSQPAHFTTNPLLAGYVSSENLKRLANTPTVSLSTFGGGLIISIADNPNFRGYWYGTNRLFLNALFFGGMISSGSAQ